MPEPWQTRDWLLIDAAGPGLATGLLRDGHWLDFTVCKDGFLESLRPEVERLTDRNQLPLNELEGILFARGPGSTLGLRLAALFLRSLMVLPGLKHWRCFQYNNLEFACASRLNPETPERMELAAPWRRDCLHRVRVEPGQPLRFVLDSVTPDYVLNNHLPIVELGHRSRNLPAGRDFLPYPVDQAPRVFNRFPELVHASREPEPYTAKEPAFARWQPQRHRAP